MNFTHYDLGALGPGDVIQVTLNGNAANIKLMDGPNFANYRSGQAHRYLGGLARRTLTQLAVDRAAHWHITVDLAGLQGSTRSAVNVVRAQRTIPRSTIMASLFINLHNNRYTVEPAHTSAPLHTAATQEAAIAWARANHPTSPLHVARVRHLSDKRNPDHWRRV